MSHKDPEQRRQYMKQWRAENASKSRREKLSPEEAKRRKQESFNRWKKANPEKYRAIQGRHRDTNIEKIRERGRLKARERRIKDPETVRAQDRAYRKAHPDRVKRSNLRHNCWTLERFQEFETKQQGMCAICGLPMGRVNADHDHETHLPRALVCSPCNSALGRLELPHWLEAALAYISMYKP